nr:MAG TPA: hypothetical protein [Bacteriophage sp.]
MSCIITITIGNSSPISHSVICCKSITNVLYYLLGV